jgi:16S rRNA (cytidine1402-2'-O)-methyltransferase
MYNKTRNTFNHIYSELIEPMGNLFIVATPIGNLQDITLRALKILEDVDFIACEDTRTSNILIKHYFKNTQKEMYEKLFSYYEKKENLRIPQIINLLLNGKNVALISDAGTPTISDPGFKLIRECIRKNIKVTSVPGPSSVISALAMSGLPTDKFIFLGFLPQKPGHRVNFLKNLQKSLKHIQSTVIFFESPYKLHRSLVDIKRVFGNINLTIVREQTKIYEEIFKGNIDQVTERYKKGVKGEITILFNLKEI